MNILTCVSSAPAAGVRMGTSGAELFRPTDKDVLPTVMESVDLAYHMIMVLELERVGFERAFGVSFSLSVCLHGSCTTDDRDRNTIFLTSFFSF